MKKVYFEISSDYDYVYEETNVDPINFTRADEDMKGTPAVCAILVRWSEDGCLCDDDSQVDFNEFETIGKSIHNLQEGVFYYNGSLSKEAVGIELIDAGYEID